VKKDIVIQTIIEKLHQEYDVLIQSSKSTREAGNDSESKAEGKYDTRSIEDNYLADGLSRQALAMAQAADAYKNLTARKFEAGASVDVGALMQLNLLNEKHWFFLGPAGGGIEITCEGKEITVLTPESPLGSQLIGLKVGATTNSPKAKVLVLE